MDYGAKMIQWAPFASSDPEPADSVPSYGTPINLGALNKVTETINWAEASGYGDNARKVYIKEFKDGNLAVETLYLSIANMAAVSGGTVEDGSEGNLHFSSEDAPPYGGLAFYTNGMTDAGAKYYQGIWYPKVKAGLEAKEYATRGDSIVLSNAKLSFAISACKSGDWKILSPEFTTEAEAASWVNSKIKAKI